MAAVIAGGVELCGSWARALSVAAADLAHARNRVASAAPWAMAAACCAMAIVAMSGIMPVNDATEVMNPALLP